MATGPPGTLAPNQNHAGLMEHLNNPNVQNMIQGLLQN